MATELETALNLLSSATVILGAIFIVYQLRQNNKLVAAANLQAKATVEQIRENTRMAQAQILGDFALQTASTEWGKMRSAIGHMNIRDYSDFMARYQGKYEEDAARSTASMYEVLAIMTRRGYFPLEVILDLYTVEIDWRKLEPIVRGRREAAKEPRIWENFEWLYHQAVSASENRASDQETNSEGSTTH